MTAAPDATVLLVERASRGEAAAVEELLETYLPRLRAFVRLRCGPQLRERESCSDIVQSVCRDLLQHMDGFRYDGEAAFRSWLFTAAARKVADRAEYWRAALRDPRRELGPTLGAAANEEALMAVYRQSCSPSEVVMGREALQRIEAAFDELPEDYREAVVLSRILGLPRPEIARLMGRSEDSVRHLLFRGLSRLSEKLAP